MGKQLAAVALAALVSTGLAACGSADAEYADGAGALSDEAFDEEAAREAAAEEVDAGSFEDVGDTSDCTEDCSGHEAGFEWAKEGNDCGGSSSQSFDEGCEAREAAIEERVEEARSEFESGSGDYDY